MGSVQWLTACTGAPVDALAPTASCSYFYHNIYRNGAYILALGRAGFGANVYGPPPSAGASPEWPKWFLTLPLMDLDDVVGYQAPLQLNMIKHIKPDGFWRETDARNFESWTFPRNTSSAITTLCAPARSMRTMACEIDPRRIIPGTISN